MVETPLVQDSFLRIWDQYRSFLGSDLPHPALHIHRPRSEPVFKISIVVEGEDPLHVLTIYEGTYAQRKYGHDFPNSGQWIVSGPWQLEIERWLASVDAATQAIIVRQRKLDAILDEQTKIDIETIDADWVARHERIGRKFAQANKAFP